MLREKNYHELLRLANIQLNSISEEIKIREQKELDYLASNNQSTVAPYFKLILVNPYELRFSIGLQHFIVKLKILLNPQKEAFFLKTYEIEDTEEIGKQILVHRYALDINGGFISFKFGKDFDKLYDVNDFHVGSLYLTNLINGIDNNFF